MQCGISGGTSTRCPLVPPFMFLCCYVCTLLPRDTDELRAEKEHTREEEEKREGSGGDHKEGIEEGGKEVTKGDIEEGGGGGKEMTKGDIEEGGGGGGGEKEVTKEEVEEEEAKEKAPEEADSQHPENY